LLKSTRNTVRHVALFWQYSSAVLSISLLLKITLAVGLNKGKLT